MRCDEKGLSLNKKELTALLEFCSDDPKSSLQFVQFKIDEHYCEAYATNGSCAVRATGETVSDERIGEWYVHRDFIELCKKALEAEQVVILAFHGASLHEATIEKEGEEVSSVGWPKDAAIAQTEIKFPDLSVVIPKGKKDYGAGTLALPGGYLAFIEKVEKAADCYGTEVFIPDDANKAVKFRVGAHKATVWTVVINTMRQEDLGRELESEQSERKTTRTKVDKRQAGLNFEEAAGEALEGVADRINAGALDGKGLKVSAKVTRTSKVPKASKKKASKRSTR